MSNTVPLAADVDNNSTTELPDWSGIDLDIPQSIETESSLSMSIPSNSVLVSTFIQNSGTLKRNCRGKSEIWKYFQIYNEKKYSNLAFCILCNKDINYGKTHSTSTLDQHLQRRHVEEFNSLMVEKTNKRLCTDVPKQSKLTDFINVKSKYEDCLLKWMMSTYQPLCAVQHQTFCEMVLSLSDKAPTLGYGKIRSLLSDKYFESL
jgi:hypothetical protein